VAIHATPISGNATVGLYKTATLKVISTFIAPIFTASLESPSIDNGQWNIHCQAEEVLQFIDLIFVEERSSLIADPRTLFDNIFKRV
jgi:hypothetical protein